jgi:hypothetical protein
VGPDTNVHKLGAKLGIDPAELLRMISGKGDVNRGGGCRAGEGSAW